MADSRGRFMFYALSPGSYSVSASASGYIPSSYGQSRPNSPGRQISLGDYQKTGNVSVKLWRYAVMTGTVLDDLGEPAISVNVRALRRQTINGRSLFQLSGAATTDDRGVYRMSNLMPGDYIVSVPASSTTMPASVVELYQKAVSSGDSLLANDFTRRLTDSGAPPPSPNGTRIGNAYVLQIPLPLLGTGRLPSNPENENVLVYQTQFFPAGTTNAQATVVTLAPGDERAGLDFQLRPVQSFKVSGTVIGPENQANQEVLIGVKLLPASSDEGSDNGLETATTVTQVDGTFTLLGIPAGAYVLKVLKIARAPAPVATSTMQVNGTDAPFAYVGSAPASNNVPTEPTLWGELQVSVTDANVSGLIVPLRTGPRVSGRIEFDGTSPRPSLARLPPQVAVNLTRSDGRSSGPIVPPTINPSGQFTTMSLPPGRYLVTAFAPGWILKSATLGGRDIADSLELEGGDVTGIVVTFFDRPAQLSGTVHNSRGDVDGSAVIFLIPADVGLPADGFPTRRFRSSTSDTHGRYSFVSVLPGDYWIAALSENPLGESYEPGRLLEDMARLGTRITIGESEHRTQDLTAGLVSIR
jgi:hypothetical protein